MNKLQKGNDAPNFDYQTDIDAVSKDYYTESQNRKSILFFLRYVGCLVCQLDIKRINENSSSFAHKKTEVFIVIQSAVESIGSYKKIQPIYGKIVSDPSSNIYKSYAVKKGNIMQFLHPNSIPKVIQSLKNGFRHGKFEGEETQLPAVFIVDKNHKIDYCYYGKNISDLPSIEELLKRL